MKTNYIYVVLLILLSLSPLLIHATFLLMKYPPPWLDEAAIISVSKYWLKTGHLTTDIYGVQLPDLSSHNFWYPPVLLYILGSWIKLFGDSLEVVRLLSLIIGVLTIITFFWLNKILFKNLWLALLGGVYLSFDDKFNQASHWVRPEAITLLFIISSLLALVLAQTKKRNIYILISGLYCGLAFLAHPLGLIASSTVFLILILRKITLKEKLKQFVYFFLPIGIMLALYAFSLRNSIGFTLMLYQTLFQTKAAYPVSLLSTMSTDFKWAIWGLFSLVNVVVFGLFSYRFKFKSAMLIITGFIVSVASVIYGKDNAYILYYLQPFGVLAAVGLIFLSLRLTRKWFFLSLVSGLTPLLISIVFYVQSFSVISNNYLAFTEEIMQNLPDKSQATVCLASSPDPYFELIKRPNLKLFEVLFWILPYENLQAFYRFCDYMVLNLLPPSSQTGVINEYIVRNQLKTMQLGRDSGYSAAFVQLLEQSKRR